MKNKFSERLKRSLKEEKYTQKQLADILGFKQPAISRYINGVQEPDFDTLILICKALDISSDYLLGLSEN